MGNDRLDHFPNSQSAPPTRMDKRIEVAGKIELELVAEVQREVYPFVARQAELIDEMRRIGQVSTLATCAA